MYGIAPVIMIFLLSMWLMGKHKHCSSDKKGISKFFDLAAGQLMWLFCRLSKKNKRKSGLGDGFFIKRSSVMGNLVKLHPGEKREEIYYRYVREKTAFSLMILSAGTMIGLGASLNHKSEGIYYFLFACLLSVVIYVLKDKDLAAKVDEKKRMLRVLYPGMLEKMVMYMEAGMTVRGAFLKVASTLDEKSPLYDEMVMTIRELKSGASQEEAYGRFGRRCGMEEYIRVASLLSQSLVRGNKDLLIRLREEAEDALIRRVRDSKKAGEQASTKLLLPMVIILTVVMVMILMPAFSNINV
jgi:pilus assembly protein TadC